MDNQTRSERSRKAAIDAALTIIARDGPGQLTFDAISRESGISKGGLMHQFPNKSAMLKALIEHQIKHYYDIAVDQMSSKAATSSEPVLAATLSTVRQFAMNPHPAAFVFLEVLVEDPQLMSYSRDIEAGTVERIKAEAADPDLSLLRWAAARGLATNGHLGMCPLSKSERERLFARLLDDSQWTGLSKAAKKAPPARRAAGARSRKPRS
jgi:AcrR family transcriptional regulator